jgi:hypothetical protein
MLCFKEVYNCTGYIASNGEKKHDHECQIGTDLEGGSSYTNTAVKGTAEIGCCSSACGFLILITTSGVKTYKQNESCESPSEIIQRWDCRTFATGSKRGYSSLLHCVLYDIVALRFMTMVRNRSARRTLLQTTVQATW